MNNACKSCIIYYMQYLRHHGLLWTIEIRSRSSSNSEGRGVRRHAPRENFKTKVSEMPFPALLKDIYNLVPRAFAWGRVERRESPGLGRSLCSREPPDFRGNSNCRLFVTWGGVIWGIQERKRKHLYSTINRGVQIRFETDPNPIRSDSFGFRNQNIHFGSDQIDKVVS
jgi:hypothetical protein